MRLLLLAAVMAATLSAQAPPPTVPEPAAPLLFVLPPPSGSAPVGTTRWIVADPVRREPFADAPRPRQVSVVAWYPAAQRTGMPASYFREGLVEIRSFARLLRQPATAFDAMTGVRTHAVVDAPPALSTAQFPLLVFSHGYTGVASAHTALLEDLASRGFVVLSINHPYESTGASLDGGRQVSLLDESGMLLKPIREVLGEWAKEDAIMAEVTRTSVEDDQRRRLREYLATLRQTSAVLERWVADTKLVLDTLSRLDRSTAPGRLAARADASSVGALGHSMGGVVSGEFCLTDRRCRAVLNLDGIPQYGGMIDAQLGRPVMMIYSSRPGRVGASDAIYRRAASRYYRADVRDTQHLDFTDMVFWAPMRQRNALGKLDPVRITQITRELVAEFFEQELRGRRSALLSGQRSLPEVVISAHGR